MAYDAEARDISIAIVGDITVNRRMSVFREPSYSRVVGVLRSADVTFGNLETTINNFELSWALKEREGGISWQAGAPECLDDLRWMGVQVVGVANNHAYDYGESGFLTTLRHVNEHGLAACGGGMNLDEARAPVLIDLPGGRVAVMAATSTFADESAAGAMRRDCRGKPGVNPLRHRILHQVPGETFSHLRDAHEKLGYREHEDAVRRFHPQRVRDESEPGRLHFLGRTFLAAEGFGTVTECDPDDLADVGRWIRSAKAHADWVVYSVHCHESGPDGEYHYASRESVPDFLVEFAHWAVDAGCDLVVAHGPHFLRGVELYRGRPIFYSLGNFIFHNDTVQRHPQPAYARQGLDDDATPGDWAAARSGGGRYGFAVDRAFFESMVAVCSYSGGELRELRLYPIDLGFGSPMSQSGRPVLAEADLGAGILGRVGRLSERFAVEIFNEKGVGVIRPGLLRGARAG
jgi:poly-gamma-glutamate capsule biosynthesis protein CapA/YwtB (metallophosphatase superfamily)